MWPTKSLAKLGSAHGTCWRSMRQWGLSAKLQIVIASSTHPLSVSTEYLAFLTTSSIGLWIHTLKFWSLPRIGGDLATGWDGFSGSTPSLFCTGSAVAAQTDHSFGMCLDSPQQALAC